MIRSRAPISSYRPMRLARAVGGLLRAPALAVALALALAAPAKAGLDDGVAAYQRGDYGAALKAFEEEAAKGDRRAQYNLGVLYLTGHGVERDLEAAALWHRRAAEQGLPEAQHGLGVLYYRGVGVARDPAEAARWFRKAADQGMADARYNLGVMYFNGEGVEENMAEVVKWISLAAGQGFADAQYRLGAMYQDGAGLPRDHDEALKWFRLAAKGGNDQAAARIRALAARHAVGAATEKTAAKTAPPPPAGGRSRTPAAPSLEASVQPAAGPVTAAPVAGPDQSSHTGTTAHAAMIAVPAPAKAPETLISAPPPRVSAPAGATGIVSAGMSVGWRVQLAAYRSDAVARRAWSRVRARYADVLKGLDPFFQRVDLGAKGVFHRLQAGPVADGTAAAELCRRLRDARQPCLVVAPARGG